MLRRLLLILMCLAWTAPNLVAQQEKDGKNPIGEFFRGLNRDIQEEAEEIKQAQLGRDQLDTRPPQDRDRARKLEQAQLLIQQGKWHDAVDVLQFLLQFGNDVFYFDERHELLSLKTQIEEIFNNLPEEAARNDTNRFAPLAESLWTQAFQLQDEELLNRLVEQFARLSAGQRALSTLATIWRDQGKLKLAAHAFSVAAEKSDSIQERQRYAQLAYMTAMESNDADLITNLATRFSLDRQDPGLQIQTTLSSESENVTSPRGIEIVPIPTSEPVDPVLVPNWSIPMIERFAVSDATASILESHLKRWAVIPTFCPVITDDKLVLRTLRSLQVRNLTSGELIWENRAIDNLESELSDSDALRQSFTLGQVTDQNAISNLLLRDHVTRGLSTDGKHVFAIEANQLLADLPSGYTWRRRLANAAQAENWQTNELVAYDLETGHIRWKLGGEETEDAFLRPLAGTYFFGPPVAAESELYVIGESSGEVSLHVIDPSTGEVLWTQMIAVASSGVETDLIRRFWQCQPLVCGHLIVCPTTCGWLVAVDRVSKRLAWAVRYGVRVAGGKRLRGGNPTQSMQSLNTRWIFPTPICIGQRLLFTPSELPDEFGNSIESCFCIDLLSGEMLWKAENRHGTPRPNLYLAGVDGDHAIFVGNDSISARSISRGGELINWDSKIDTGGQLVSGRAMMLNRELLVPVGTSQLVRFDLDQGKQVGIIDVTGTPHGIGNLSYHNGQLIGVSSETCTVFPIHQGTNRSPSPELLLSGKLSEIEGLMNQGEFVEALAALHNLQDNQDLSAARENAQQAIEQLRWRILAGVIRADPDLAAMAFDDISNLHLNPQQQRELLRLQIDHFNRSEDWSAALPLCWELLQQSPPQELISDDSRMMTVDVWVGGRLRDLFANLPQTQHEPLRQAIENELNAIESLIGSERLGRVLSRTPLGPERQFGLAQDALNRKATAESLTRFQRIAAGTHSEWRVQAWIAMAEILESLGSHSDAITYWEQVQDATAFPTTNGPNSVQRAATKLQALKSHAPASSSISDGPQAWEVIRVGSRVREDPLVRTESRGDPFDIVLRHQFVAERQQRMRIQDPDSGLLKWSFPLQSANHLRRHAAIGMLHSGAMTYIINQGVIHAVTSLDHQIRWTYTPELTGESAMQLRRPSEDGSFVMDNVRRFRQTSSLQTFTAPGGYLSAVCPEVVIVYDNKLRALDSLTGELLWTDSKIGNRTNVIPWNGQLILVEGNAAPLVLDSLDGAKIESDWDQEFSAETIDMIAGDRLLLRRVDQEGQADKWELRRESLDSGTLKWSHQIADETLLERVDEQTIVTFAVDGNCQSIDLSTGQVIDLCKAPVDDIEKLGAVYCFHDSERIYLYLTHGFFDPSSNELRSVNAPGLLVACSRRGGELWSLETAEIDKTATNEKPPTPGENEPNPRRGKRNPLRLLTDDVEVSPLLLFTSAQPEFRGVARLNKLQLIAIDKSTGKQVVDWQRYSNSTGLSYIHYDVQEGVFDMWTQNERLQLLPMARSQAEN